MKQIMITHGLDHINVQTLDLNATVKFYADVLDLEARDPPAHLDPERVRWMFSAGERAIFHLTVPGSILDDAATDELSRETGPVHHVALLCSGYDAMIERLTALGLAHRVSYSPSIDLKQIFLHDPNGVMLELNYPSGNH